MCLPRLTPTDDRADPQTRAEPDRQQALELLASCPGCTEAIMLAHGVHAGLATATAERVVAGNRAAAK